MPLIYAVLQLLALALAALQLWPLALVVAGMGLLFCLRKPLKRAWVDARPFQAPRPY